MGQAPPAILALDAALKKNLRKPKSYQFSGIVGDVHHSHGYHLSPRDIGSRWDYSLQTPRDKVGKSTNSYYASAWDLSFNQSDMRLVTNRLLTACKNNDPRVAGIREFCGTLDNKRTYPWDHHGNYSEGVGSWDSSHLWHVHISIYRDVCNNYAAIKGIVDVICGVPIVVSPKPPVKPVTPSPVHHAPTTPISVKPIAVPAYPLGRRDYFGDINGDYHTHGGNPRYDNVIIIHWIKVIQTKLVKGGFAGKVNPSWVDGKIGPQTILAIKRFQRTYHWPQTGRIGANTWKLLFSKVK